MFKPLFVLLLSIFLFAACDSADSDNVAPRFDVAFFEKGATMADGQISFDTEPRVGQALTGTYSFTTPDGDPLEPLTVTSGSMSATLDDSGMLRVTITDPVVSDSGLQLEGDYAASGYSGVWGTITFPGYSEKGTFTATAMN
jgi:hypothetical protein